MFPIMAGNSASTGYNLTRSLRFRASASGYLSRAPASTTNQKTLTYSVWFKRGTLGTNQTLIEAYTGGGGQYTIMYLTSGDVIRILSAGTTELITTQVFRDPSAWYHVVLAIDTTQATAANRIKLYVNGTQVTAFTTAAYPALNDNTYFNRTTAPTYISESTSTGNAFPFDGYMTEINFVDGLQLTSSSFGSTNALTGVWQPARYTGTYGTNGFYLPFTDNSALTTSSNVGLGKDFSGNGNYWTTNNISLTSGVTYDSMTDVPTLTSATAANFAVLNPLDKSSYITTSNANLAASSGTALHGLIRSSIAIPSSGKWYAEISFNQAMNGNPAAGFALISPSANLNAHIVSAGNYSVYGSSTTTLNSGATGGATVTGMTTGQIWQFAVDADNNQSWIGLNNAWFNVYTSGATTGNPSALTNPTFTGTMAGLFLGADFINSSGSINFGQRPFTYTPPTGFVALKTYNVPKSTIVKGNKVMDATLYTGTGASLSVTNTASFKPDLVWTKSRSAAYWHKLTDSVRGATKALVSNVTDAETTDTQGLTAFGSAGFTVGTNADYNGSGQTFVAWQWQAGQGSSSSNTNGTITSTVSVNASAGFSVVTYTGTGAAATVGHGLGVAPQFIIVKSRSAAGTYWQTYVAAISNMQNGYLELNTTGAFSTATNTVWNGTQPTSSVFSIGTSTQTNQNTTTYVAYCWTPITGFSAFGSYTGNGSADGPFVYTGFRPKFVIIKGSSFASNWFIQDSARNGYNVNNGVALRPNLSNAEDGTTTYNIDILSNGFKLRSSAGDSNTNGATFVYAAFAENPTKNALAR